MSLAMDDTELSPEMQSIKFEWTPQLKEFLARGYHIHPYIGPEYAEENAIFYERYKPGMPLPDPDDPVMYLQWCGLTDETAQEVANKFYEEKKGLVAQTPNRGYITKKVPAGFYDIYYPILDGMVDTCLLMLGSKKDGKFDFDYEYSYEGYVKKAIQRGLKPEFAIFCGFHEDDPRAKREPDWFLRLSPMGFAQDLVVNIHTMLTQLVKRKLVCEGKVYVDEDRSYVIVEDQQSQQEEETQEQKLPEVAEEEQTEHKAGEEEE